MSPSPSSQEFLPLSRLRSWGDAIFRIPFGWFVVFTWLLALAENGIWLRPGVSFIERMASDPFRNVLAEAPVKHYLYSSYLGIVIAWLFGAYRHSWSFLLLHFAELVAGGSAVLYWARRRHGDGAARMLALVFVCGPLSNVLLTWLGIGDNLVFVFSSFLVLTEGPVGAFVAAFLLGLSHLEQAVAISVMLAMGVLIAGTGEESFGKRAAAKACGMLVGVGVADLVLKILFSRLNFNLQGDRIKYVADAGPAAFLSRFFHDPTAAVWSFHLVAWLPLVALLRQIWPRRGLAWWFVVVQAMAGLISMIVIDVTRVFALVSWPMEMVLILAWSRASAEARTRSFPIGAFALCVILSAVIPKVIYWDGRMHSTVRYEDVLFLFGKVDTLHGDWTFLPFP